MGSELNEEVTVVPETLEAHAKDEIVEELESAVTLDIALSAASKCTLPLSDSKRSDFDADDVEQVQEHHLGEQCSMSPAYNSAPHGDSPEQDSRKVCFGCEDVVPI